MNKKAQEGVNWIIIGLIIALVVAAIVIVIVRTGLLAGKQSASALNACESRKGECKQKGQCDGGIELYRYGGCDRDKNSGKIIPVNEETGKLVYCCIPEETEAKIDNAIAK